MHPRGLLVDAVLPRARRSAAPVPPTHPRIGTPPLNDLPQRRMRGECGRCARGAKWTVLGLMLAFFGCASSRTTRDQAGSSSGQASADTVPGVAHPRTSWQPSPEAIGYFLEVAFGVEVGERTDRFHAWHHTVRVRVDGSPGADDSVEVDRAIAEINAASGTDVLHRVSGDADLWLSFVDAATMRRRASGVPRDAEGFTYVWWDAASRIREGRIWIHTDLSVGRRQHAIREELAQALGLLGDSWRYPDSMFYQGRTTLVSFSPLDVAVLRLLAENRALTGLSRAAVRERLEARYGVRATGP